VPRRRAAQGAASAVPRPATMLHRAPDVARPQRLGAFDYIGRHRYFVTFCTLNRRPLFVDADLVASIQSHFLEQAARFACAIIAYCFMPDHVHLLIEGLADDADMRAFTAIAKQKSGFEFAARDGHRLWQKGYYERVLRDEETSRDIIRCILANPMRSGLVVEPAEYPFWGSGVYTRDELTELIACERHR
jgi:putative transposase